MSLAGMIATDEQALICDMAETYRIYNYRALPVKTIGVLASGLRENSRIKMKLSGLKVGIETMLLAAAADRLGMLVWMQSEDGRKNRNRPKSILNALINDEKKENDIMAFSSIEEFEYERHRLLEKR